MFIKLDRAKSLSVLNWESSGITPDMIKCRGKYVEVGIKEIKEPRGRGTKTTLIPNFKGIVVNNHVSHELLRGHTLLLTINPTIAKYAGLQQMYIVEEDDIGRFGNFHISFVVPDGMGKIEDLTYMYRIYGLN